MKPSLILITFVLFASHVRAEPPPAELVTSLLDAVGGEAKMLRVFRIKENRNEHSRRRISPPEPLPGAGALGYRSPLQFEKEMFPPNNPPLTSTSN